MDRLPRKEKGIRISTKAVNVFVFILSFFLITFIMFQSDLSIIFNNKSSVNSLSKLLHEEKQYFNLVSIDGYFWEGFIDGESVYIFQTEDNNVLSNLYILPVSNTTVITNSIPIGFWFPKKLIWKIDLIQKQENLSLKKT